MEQVNCGICEIGKKGMVSCGHSWYYYIGTLPSLSSKCNSFEHQYGNPGPYLQMSYIDLTEWAGTILVALALAIRTTYPIEPDIQMI